MNKIKYVFIEYKIQETLEAQDERPEQAVD
jgi:hypothetical protein